MGRARGKTSGTNALARGEPSALPDTLTKVLPKHTARAWRELRLILPQDLYLIGGTAVAVHLGHRESIDLDFVFHEGAVDLGALHEELGALPEFTVTYEGAGTLRGLHGPTKVEIFHADELAPQHVLEAPSRIAGLRVASLKDLMAMKLKVIRDRSQMRDYYDLKMIDEEGGISIEAGLSLFLERYDAKAYGEEFHQIIRALGYLDDAKEDESLPITKAELSKWWRARQAELVRNLDRNPL